MIWKEVFPQLVSTTILLQAATMDDLDLFFDQYSGATGGGGWWFVREEGTIKIDILGLDSAESAAVSSRYGSWIPTDWEPASALAVYAKGGSDAATALRDLLTKLLERFEGVVIWPDDRDRPMPQEVWCLEEILTGSNRSGVALFSK